MTATTSSSPDGSRVAGTSMTLPRKSSSSDGEGEVAERARRRKTRKLSQIFGDTAFLDYPGYVFSATAPAPRTCQPAPPLMGIEEVGQAAISTEGLIHQSCSEESTVVEDADLMKPRDLPFSDKSNLKTLADLGHGSVQTSGWKLRERRLISDRQSEVRRTRKMNQIFGEVPPVGMVKRLPSCPSFTADGHSSATHEVYSSASHPKALFESALSEESLAVSDTKSDRGQHNTIAEYDQIEGCGGFPMDIRLEGSDFHDRRRRAAKLARFFGESKFEMNPPEPVVPG